MSDIDTKEEPEDILEQLRLDEFMEWQDEQERAEEKEPTPPPSPVEMDLARASLGPDFGYVVYYSQPH
jgi:hypothetical protein